MHRTHCLLSPLPPKECLAEPAGVAHIAVSRSAPGCGIEMSPASRAFDLSGGLCGSPKGCRSGAAASEQNNCLNQAKLAQLQQQPMLECSVRLDGGRRQNPAPGTLRI